MTGRIKQFITYLYRRFVYEPEVKARQAAQETGDYVIMFEPAPEWVAQVEKDVTKPRLNQEIGMDSFEKFLVSFVFGLLLVVIGLLFAQHQLDAARYYDCIKSGLPALDCQRPRNGARASTTQP